MIAKIVGYGRTRAEARARVLRALRETTIVIRGGMTNKSFLAALLEHPDVAAGRFDTTWLDRLMTEGGPRTPERRAIALIATAIAASDANRAVERGRFFQSATRGRPQSDAAVGYRVDLHINGASYTFEVHQTGAGRYRVAGRRLPRRCRRRRGGPFERRLVVAGLSFRVLSVRQGAETLVEVDGIPHRVSQDDGGLVRAPAPGVLVHIAVSPGDEVQAGDRLATLESMKMEVALQAPAAGRVGDVLAAVGAPVDAGSPLFRLETALATGAAPPPADRAGFADLAAPDGGDPARASRGARRASVPGPRLRPQRRRDPPPGGGGPAAPRGGPGRRPLHPPGGAGRPQRLCRCASLGRNRRGGEDEEAEDVHSPREFFHAFLQTMDATRAGLPPSFETRLRAALADYDVGG